MGISDPDSNVHGANMGPAWVLSAQVGPMLAPRTLLSGDIFPCVYANHWLVAPVGGCVQGYFSDILIGVWFRKLGMNGWTRT